VIILQASKRNIESLKYPPFVTGRKTTQPSASHSFCFRLR